MILVLLALCDTSWIEVQLFSGMNLSSITLRTNTVFEVEASRDSVIVNGQGMSEFSVWGSQDKEISLFGGEVVRTYRGLIRIRSVKGKLSITNKLRLEDYLASVVAAEIGQAPDQALMAQAVLSRTLAHRHVSRSGLAFADNESFQVYHGTGALTQECLDAVRATRNQVLMYKGKLVEVFFHGACGGHTALASQVWSGHDLPYLAFVVDSPCLFDSTQNWRKSISVDQLRKQLGTGDCPSVAKVDSSGRAALISIGRARIKATVFRKKLKLRSTMISSITCSQDTVIITGRGYGHGIGMCQTGAALRAEAGSDYKQILGFYYPGAEIVCIDREKAR